MEGEAADRAGTSFSTALIAGAGAGLSVDLLFFPIDTIKTRLQSSQGFWRAGGFSGVYRGMGSVAVGSAPGASLFFVTYETLKGYLAKTLYPNSSRDAVENAADVHMLAASCAEVTACLVRVPTDVVKSRQQTAAYGRISSLNALRTVVASEGVRGLYRGYASTILREIPFTCIQFPLYEWLKREFGRRESTEAWWHAPVAGSVAGSVAAACSTPLDVIKTRIMLAKTHADAGVEAVEPRFFPILRSIVQQGGIKALFAGVVPRVTWIGIGGAVFLGTFDLAARTIDGKN
ncbi:S-adenosylmethionine transporter [Malassezia cuniculi]|uniref:S-adenosylmethionine transporter n=1 Tax=Malassezia cuniculi TaxID=948313 RepID=A0AAF0ETY7_9BASI|nr:S-adenosylmethionine transporter [Malassezia cuniculi]